MGKVQPPENIWAYDDGTHIMAFDWDNASGGAVRYVRADRIAALEAQLAEAKGKLNEIACWSQSQGLLWWQVKAREGITALEATPPASTVTEGRLLTAACQAVSVNWTLSGDQVERLFKQVLETHATLTAAQEAPKVTDDATVAARFSRLHGIVSRIFWRGVGMPAFEHPPTRQALIDLCEYLFAAGIDAALEAVKQYPTTTADEADPNRLFERAYAEVAGFVPPEIKEADR